MPDRLEDFEGFYGLEEIDDVAVIKDSETGFLHFETTKTEEQVAQELEAAQQAEQESLMKLQQQLDEEQNGDEPENNEKDDDEESWEGFSEEEAGGEPVAEPESQSPPADAQSTKESKVVDKKEKEGKKETKKEKKEKKKNEKAKNDAAAAAAAASGKKSEESDDEEKEEEEQAEEARATLGKGAFDILADRPSDDDEAVTVDVSAWDGLGLSEDTLESLSRLKFSQPTTIQSSAIPEILTGHDVVGKASTGSGKTLAFGIPILEHYLKSGAGAKDKSQKAPTALIISPTRELAHQISSHLTALGSGGSFDEPHIATITGGLSVQKQRRQLEKADIIVGTPGRLWEVISSGQGQLGSFKSIKFLVIDEADRLLSEGHYKELGEILNVLDKDDDIEEGIKPAKTSEVERQTLVFSATFAKGLQQKLAGKVKHGGGLMNKQESLEYLLKKLHFREDKPKFIDANPTSQMATGLKEGLVECAGTEKDLYLYSLLMFHPNKRALIFTNSISAVRRLTPFLQNLDLPALPLHSNMPQKARLRSIERFTEKAGSILVATDVAARGLDIPGVQLIIHYHLPRAADTYVHRSGRTARAESSGSSILICAPEEVAGVRRLVAKVHARSQTGQSKKTAFFIRTLDIDRRVVSRLKPRATLSKKLADAVIAKEKKHSEDDWMRAAAEELGVDYDSETFEKESKGRKGRGSGRKQKEREARELTKGELQGLRAQLKGLLSQRVNIGVSERYLTSGGIDVDALVKGEGNAEFLGTVDGLGLEDE
ncbi:DEAD-domain-containing protein [Corynespora cassiicola Philippines]|uniref:ATP-dependent RNA helicase n=1 Tax=Corynespora cassiicola Philippines TaxID=1448308 RepID=A0A2T2PCP8_CORCC|nr:DEAD-domain-containing protein [Corynespora cassiicola Philippines]